MRRLLHVRRLLRPGGEGNHEEAERKGDQEYNAGAHHGASWVHGRLGAFYAPRAEEGNQMAHRRFW
jgi:hypothetical protein